MSEGELTGTTNTRLSRLEQKYDDLARVVDRVEQNQQHAEELNVLRFGALNTAIAQIGLEQAARDTKVTAFMARIEGMIDGTVETAQMRSGREMVKEYQEWRKEVDADREAQAVRNGKLDLMGRLVYGMVGANIAAIIGGILFLASGNHL